MPGLSIVIPTSGNPRKLELTLAGIYNQEIASKIDAVEVLVCDDGINDRVSDVVAGWSGMIDVHCCRTHAGRGAGYARNRGVETADYDRVLFLDDDCVPAPGLVEFHLSFGSRPQGVIGMRRMVNPEHHNTLYRNISSGTMHEVPWEPEARAAKIKIIRHLSQKGAATLFNRAFTCHVSYPTNKLREVGGFWEAFRGAGYEDLELAIRLTRVGVKLQFVETPVVYHQNHPQTHHQIDNIAHNRALYLQTLNDLKVTKRGSLKEPL